MIYEFKNLRVEMDKLYLLVFLVVKYICIY